MRPRSSVCWVSLKALVTPHHEDAEACIVLKCMLAAAEQAHTVISPL